MTMTSDKCNAPVSNAPVMVSGANGYVASWLVKQLLEQGYTVHATVRNKTNKQKVGHLLDLANDYPQQLKLFEADLFKEGSFAEAMQGCSIVFHTASPFLLSVDDPQQQLIEPALQGTRNVLKTVNNTASVQRVVLTSSTVAIYGDAIEVLKQPSQQFTEQVWNESSSATHQPYSYSKVIAEREAWAIQRAQNRWDMVTVNPGFVLGPSLSGASDSESINTMLQLMKGKLKSGVPALYFPIVDVRDVAEGHIKAAFTASATGRYSLVSSSGSLLDMAHSIEKAYPNKLKLPTKQVPKFMIWLFGPLLKLSRKFVKLNVGYRPDFDNTRAKLELQMTFRPIEQSVADHAQQLINDGFVR